MTDAADIDPGLLPEALAEMVDVVGLAAVLELVAHWGGVRLWVPSAVDAEHALARRLGLPAATALCQYAGGAQIAIPKAERALRECRDRAIRSRRAAGEPAHKLAREFGLTERQIFTITATHTHDDRQEVLFKADGAPAAF